MSVNSVRGVSAKKEEINQEFKTPQRTHTEFPTNQERITATHAPCLQTLHPHSETLSPPQPTFSTDIAPR